MQTMEFMWQSEDSFVNLSLFFHLYVVPEIQRWNSSLWASVFTFSAIFLALTSPILDYFSRRYQHVIIWLWYIAMVNANKAIQINVWRVEITQSQHTSNPICLEVCLKHHYAILDIVLFFNESSWQNKFKKN